MCIIIAKKRGVKFPPLYTVKNCIKNNPDGAAISWSEAGRVHTYRTLSATRFLSKYVALSQKGKDIPAIIHARIATHGSVNQRNCHGWKLFPGKQNELSFMHNGILHLDTVPGWTDSETFLRNFFAPAFRVGGWDLGCTVIEKFIGASKFAFIDRPGQIHLFGRFIDVDNVLYSNYSFMSHVRLRGGK